MYEVLNGILECIEFISGSVTTNLADIVKTWDRSALVYAGAVEKVDVSWKVPLDTEFLEEFPDIRIKVVKKLECLENEQINILQLLIKRLFQINECLKVKLERINNRLEQMSFDDHNDIIHSVRKHVMWIEDCWTCLHCFYMQLEFAMMSLQVSDANAVINLINATEQDEKEKLTIGNSQTYMQSCISLLKFLENKSKLKINPQ